MKEKIGMEKLIELLNEYELGEDYGDMGEYYYIDTLGNIVDDGGYILKPCEIISKQFGFIKWLVENDKIDLGEKLFNLTKNDNRKSMICDLDNNDFSWEDTFLMLLSISSSPIDDLISYLK